MMLTNEDLQALSQLLDQKLKTELQPMKENIHILKEDVSFLKNKTTSLEIHLDNVTDRNIQSLAEGHLNLYIKLNKALKVETEKELLIIRVGILEDELRRVKERLNQIA